MRFHASVLPAIAAGALLLALLPVAPPEPPPENLPPVCDTGGPYFVEANGQTTIFQLDGTGSYDPEGDPLTFLWSETCAGVDLMNPTSPTPTLYINMNNLCLAECGQIRLRVTAGGQTSECTTFVVVRDTTPPTIECPPDLELDHDADTSPAATGVAVVTDLTNPNPTVSYVDSLSRGPANSKILSRMWMADDGCARSRCVQRIFLRPPPPRLDIQPGMCPNIIEVPMSGGSSTAVITMALLGGPGFDPFAVDLASVRLIRWGIANSPAMAPTVQTLSDTGTPVQAIPCECHAATGDGITDLSMVFNRAQLIEIFDLRNVPQGSVIEFAVEGFTLTGDPFVGVDCATILQF